ncbi:hypothetical protein L3Y34_003877 [Caenorhabditis briggsae]|uniref:Glycosyltransferase family 92 protein n=1 Tax=Caenorhabditis briggsae TaxID=6238 RepID=A0AAE9AAJ3_CAEBR|nr:hypothetical protein L3Y34_003877 [Caenorhabditis briggsae]
MRIRIKFLTFLIGFLVFLPFFCFYIGNFLSINEEDYLDEEYEVLKSVELISVEQTTKSKLKPKPDNIISKSVLIGYSNADNLTIFSSFTGPKGTTVILSSYGYLNRRVYCRLFDANKKEIYQKAVSVFPEFTIKCSEDASLRPAYVAVTINKKDIPRNMKRMLSQETKTTTSQKKSELTVCLAPLFGESPKVLMLIEFIEYYKLQGADNFLIYSFQSTQETEHLLNFYRNSSSSTNMEIIRIGNETKCLNRHRCRHEMQLQDCVFRNQYKAEWVVTVDLDERIMPIDEDSTLLSLTRKRRNSKISELRFRCQWTLRYSDVSPGPPQIKNLPMIVWHNTSHVAPQNHTTKSIIRPENMSFQVSVAVNDAPLQKITVTPSTTIGDLHSDAILVWKDMAIVYDVTEGNGNGPATTLEQLGVNSLSMIYVYTTSFPCPSGDIRSIVPAQVRLITHSFIIIESKCSYFTTG